jgi:hypothetical protein
MKSSITEEFRKAFARLPKNNQRQARTAYTNFKILLATQAYISKKSMHSVKSIRFASRRLIVRLVLYRMM